jgi:hypothetical protein
VAFSVWHLLDALYGAFADEWVCITCRAAYWVYSFLHLLCVELDINRLLGSTAGHHWLFKWLLCLVWLMLGWWRPLYYTSLLGIRSLLVYLLDVDRHRYRHANSHDLFFLAFIQWLDWHGLLVGKLTNLELFYVILRQNCHVSRVITATLVRLGNMGILGNISSWRWMATSSRGGSPAREIGLHFYLN